MLPNLYILTQISALIINSTHSTRRYYKEYYQDPLNFLEFQNFINTVVKPKLETRTPNLREWLYFNFDVQDAILAGGDGMNSTVPIIEDLLQNTNIEVIVVNGQLDHVIPNSGTLRWVQDLNWSGANAWKAAPRNPLVVEGIVEGYVKQTDRLRLWGINRAGHETFYHNPIAGYQLIQEIIAGLKKK